MDLTPTATSTKSAEPEPDAPTRIQPVSFTNGVLKRHQQLSGGAAVVVRYKECLKNHAATLGGHALDGCGEFMPSPSATSADPTSLKCAACSCHRNFHRRDPEEPPPAPPHTHVIEYQPHHRHHPPPPPLPHGSPNSASPPPISSSYYPSAPHMLLALSAANHHDPALPSPPTQGSRKRFRTKFSQTQKEKMQEFADRVGWKIQRRDDELVHRFCDEVGVDRGVLKVWMHNNKNTLGGKRDGANGNGIAHHAAGENPDDQNHRQDNAASAAANGSSSSS